MSQEAVMFSGIEPKRAHDTDAGYDLAAAEFTTIPPLGYGMIDTGTHIAIPEHHVGLVVGRSGLAKHGVDVLGGVVDPGYTGSVRAILANHATHPLDVEVGDRIAQLLIIPIADTKLVRVGQLPDAERGAAGFGSTGR